MKWNVQRLIALLLLIALSVGFGFAYDATATAVEKNRYPRPEWLESAVQVRAEKYAVPEAMIWAVLRNESRFESNAVSEDGRIGLMQLTPDRFYFVATEIMEIDSPDAGLLYDPATNLEYGVAYLSYLYRQYGVWDLVFAAYRAGTGAVDAWLTSPAYTDENGLLIEIPDRDVAQYVKKMNKAVDLYRALYYQP
jgi:soluble lytic murein transglycosylase